MFFSFNAPTGTVRRQVGRFVSLLALPALVLTSACKDDDDSPSTPAPAPQNIVQLAQANANLSTLVAAVVKTDLAGTLSGTTELTVFAPTNAAFEALPAPFKTAASINAITDAPTIAALRGILLYHVIAGDVKAAAITSGPQTTQRTRATAAVNDNTVYLSKNATGVFINGSTQVTTADVDASNGVVHVINKVLLPPSQNIVQIAQANPNLTALVAAVVKTGLAGTLSDNAANFTVFAPTDAAFAALPIADFRTAASINAITDPATIAALSNVLLYHAAAARVFSADLTNNQVVTTAAAAPNNTVTITTTGSAKVKGRTNTTASNITAVDILAVNGVVHVIDQVLLP